MSSRQRDHRHFGETDKTEMLAPARRGPTHEQIARATLEFEARGGRIERLRAGSALSMALNENARPDQSVLNRNGHLGRDLPVEWN